MRQATIKEDAPVKRYKLLAIDDSADNLLSLRAVLNDLMPDIEFITASDWESGLEVAAKQLPDAILLDIVMPGMDGYEVCRRLKGDERLRDVPVTFLTAWRTSPDVHKRAIEAGAEGFLTKPFDEGELVSQIKAMFRQSSASRSERLEKERLSEAVSKATAELRLELAERREAEARLKLSNERLMRSKETMAKLLETLRKENEARIESERHFRDLADNGMALVWTAGLDMKCDYFNQPWLAFTGRSMEQELGDAWVEGVHPDDVAECLRIYTGAFERREKFSMTYRLRRHDGAYRWIVDEGTPRYGTSGDFIGYIGHCLDITDELEARDIAKKSEEEFRLLVESAPVGIFIQVDRRFSFINPAALRMFGAKKEDQIIGSPILDRFHPDYHELVNSRIEELNVRKHEVPYIQEICLKVDGEPFPVEISAVPFNFDGKDGALVFFNDISARKRAEKLLEEERVKLLNMTNMLNTLLDTIPDGILLLDRKGNIEWANNATRAMVGDGRQLGEDEKCYSYLFGLERPCEECPLDGVFDNGDQVSVECALDNGSTWDIRIVPVSDGAGRYDRALEIARDITLQKKTEEQLRQAQKMESVGRLAGGVAHDFNNLITAIIGNCEMALMELKDGDPIRDYLEEIKKAGDNASGLTRQLLAFSRKQVLQPVVMSLNHIIMENRRMLTRLIRENISYEERLAAELGPIEADVNQVEQVLMNLVINASDAMPDGGKLTLETYAVDLASSQVAAKGEIEPGRYAVLAISDTGVGMSEETMKHIFEPFFTTKEKGKGTGLGLSTVYGIVSQSKGSITVYSEIGKGSTFKVYFRCVEKPVDKQAPKLTGPLTGNERILLVENDDDVRSIIAKQLRQFGYAVVEASDGADALQLFADAGEGYDLVLTDVIMPRLGGRQLAEEALKIKPSQKVLFMTGYTENSIVHNGVLEAGIHFIGKPFTAEELGRKVRIVLEGK